MGTDPRSFSPLTTQILTHQVALHLQVSNSQSEDGEFIEPGAHIFRKGQQASQLVQLLVESVSMPLGGIGLHALRGWWFGAGRGKGEFNQTGPVRQALSKPSVDFSAAATTVKHEVTKVRPCGSKSKAAASPQGNGWRQHGHPSWLPCAAPGMIFSSWSVG